MRMAAAMGLTLPTPGPLRRLTIGLFATNVGDGAWFTAWAVFFTRQLHHHPSTVGLVLTAAGAVALLAPTPTGRMADHWGARGVLLVVVAVQAISMLFYLAAAQSAVFVVLVVVNTCANRAGTGLKTTLIAQLVEPHERLPELARQRVASHAGYTIGAAGGALCLAIDSWVAFALLIAVNASTSVLYLIALVGVRLDVRTVGRPVSGDAVPSYAVRDLPFVAVSLLTAVLALCWGLLSTGLPLWIAAHTGLPQVLSAAVVVVNSIGITALQVRAGRGSDSVEGASRRLAQSGMALALACVLLSFTGLADDGTALLVTMGVLVVVAGLVHLAGELWFVAGQWGLTLAMTPDGAIGDYQGVAATGTATAQMVAPLIMTSLVVDWGQPGWYVLGAGFLVAGIAVAPVAKWGQGRLTPRSAPAVRSEPVPATASPKRR